MNDIIGGTGGNSGAGADLVKDGTIETFQADVMQASLEVPVIVDFWASWCGPCRTLGPILEKEVAARGGQVRMVKIDTDKNQMLAQQLRIQSLPTVMAFVGGQPVDGFTGALPESQVKMFLDRVVDAAAQAGLGGQAGADAGALLEEAGQRADDGDIAGAMQLYGAAADAAEMDSDVRSGALAGLARCSLSAGNREQAEQMLSMVPDAHKDLPAVAQVRAMMALTENAPDPSALAAAEAAATRDPTDPEALFALGTAQIDAGQVEDGVATLLQCIERDRDWNDGAARQKLLTVFEALSPTHPAVKAGRRRLSSLLFA